MELLIRAKDKVLKAACLLSALCCLILLLIKIYYSLSYIPDISGSETSTIFPIQFLSDNRPIYTDPEKPPFRFTQYTPLYMLAASSVYKLTSWETGDPHKTFLVSRFLSLTFILSSCLILFFLIFKISRRDIHAAVLAPCFIFQVLGFWFLTSSRPDSLVVLLTSLYIGLVYKAITSSEKNLIWWILAIFISVTAFFAKQSGAVHAVALASFCFYTRNWKLLVQLFIFGCLFFALYLLILPIGSLSDFFANVVGGVKNSISLAWFYEWTLEKLLLQFAPLIILNFAINLYVFRKRREKNFVTFLSVASSLFFAFATCTALKLGSGVGYYQDYLIIAVMQITFFVTNQTRKVFIDPYLGKALLSAYVVIMAVHCTLFVYTSYSRNPTEQFAQEYTTQRKIAAFLKSNGLTDLDWIYVSEGENFHGFYLKHFLYRNILIPFSDLVAVADKNNEFKFTEFKHMVKKKRIKYVIAKQGTLPTNVFSVPFEDLRKILTIDTYVLYEVKDT